MAIARFLAMTAAEIRANSPLPSQLAWMACHFSPYSTSLSNLPRALPRGSLLILNDVTPIHGHDPEVIAAQLMDCITALGCQGILLDFQRRDCGETARLAARLAALPCPVAVSEAYGAALECPVFLPPCPLHVPVSEYLAPWQGREIWLEQALDGEVITLTESGAAFAPLSQGDIPAAGFPEEALRNHYHIDLAEDAARFTLWRAPEDLEGLLEEAEKWGVTTAVGLYQEFRAAGHRV